MLGTILAAELEGRVEAGRPATGAKPTLDDAISHLERARPSRPLDTGLALTLGRLYLTKRDFAKARELLDPVLEREPEHAEAAYLIAQAQLGAGDLEGAARSLDTVIAAEPQFTRALIDRADVALRQRRWDDAAAAFGKAAAAMPDRLDLKLRQASALLRGGRHDAARDLLETVERDRGDDARVPFLLVDVERARHDYQRAERAARRVIELEPDRVTGYHALAQVLADRREHRAIVDALAPAITRLEGKEDARALVALRASIGVAYLQLREFDAGIAAIDRARRDGGADPGLDALRDPGPARSGQGGRGARRRDRGPARRSGQPAPARPRGRDAAAARRARQGVHALPAIDRYGRQRRRHPHRVRRPAARGQGVQAGRDGAHGGARALSVGDVDSLPARRRLRGAGPLRGRRARLPRCAADRPEARSDASTIWATCWPSAAASSTRP